MENKVPVIRFADADILGGDATVLYGLNMEVYPGDFVYIVGKVGTGKTSIIRTMIAENPLGKGTGQVCGYDLEVLSDVGMDKKAHKMPHQLSGGEQQRIAIARALLNKPGVIIADEPTGNLDGETADGIMRLLRRINAEGTAIVMVTHNRAIFEKYPGRTFVCKDEGCSEQLDDEPIDLALTI